MPRNGYTSITVPVELRDRLKEASGSIGHRSVPRMLEAWLGERTGAVPVQDGPASLAPEALETSKMDGPFADSHPNAMKRRWCGRRDLNPGRLRGRLGRGSMDKARLHHGMLDEFREFLEVDRQLAPRTVYHHAWYIGKLIDRTGEAGLDELREFMRGYMGGSASGYSNALKAVKVFFRDFLGRGDLVESFKFPATPFKPRTVPSRDELRAFYDEISTIEGRLYFLLYATSGLRRKEGLSLRLKDVNEELRMVSPNKGMSGTKNTWVSFYNKEMAELLEDYTPKPGRRWIPIRTDDFKNVWRIPAKRTCIAITPQILRDWFCVAMGEAGVQDRYVDAFCGRVPKTILAKHYTDYSPMRLKKIYDMAKLEVFG